MGTHYTLPVITYKSISINGVSVSLSGQARASYQAPCNRIDFEMLVTNCSLSAYEARVTRLGDPYDIGVGNLAY